MLAVVGYNASRFHLSIDGTGDRARRRAALDRPHGRPRGRLRRRLHAARRRLRPGDARPRQRLPRPAVAPRRALALLVHRGDGPGPACSSRRCSPSGRCGASSGATRTSSRCSCSAARWCCASSGWSSAATTTCASRPTAWRGSSCSAGSSTARRPRPMKLLTTALCLLTAPRLLRPPRARVVHRRSASSLLVWCREVPLPRFAVRGRRARRRGEHGDLRQPLPDLPAARPQPAARRGRTWRRSPPASPSGSPVSTPPAWLGAPPPDSAPAAAHRHVPRRSPSPSTEPAAVGGAVLAVFRTLHAGGQNVTAGVKS